MKRLLAVFLFSITFAAALYVGYAAFRTNRSIAFLHDIQKDIENGNFQRFTDFNQSTNLTVVDNSIIYRHGSRDVTHDIKVAQPNYQKILEFYLTDPARFRTGKIILDGPWVEAPDGSKRRLAGYLTHSETSITSSKFY